jgi:hypothetical protein
VVGHGHRGHAKLLNPVNEFLDVASAVEQRVIAMQMQVDELVLAHEALWLLVFSGSDSFYRLEDIAQRLKVVQFG